MYEGYRDVTLVSGRVVRVYVPPVTRVYDLVTKKRRKPQPPVVEEETATGETIRMVIENDPQYRQDLADWDDLVADEMDGLNTLFSLKDEKVPEGWDAEDNVGEIVRYFDPSWSPREGAVGRKLDWIEWELLSDPRDATMVGETINELLTTREEVVDSTVESFPGDVERKAA